MKGIILDCDLMRYPNAGLYHYCLNLGNTVQEVGDPDGINIKYYVPKSEVQSFRRKENVIVEKRLHRFFQPFLRNCRVWHAPFQSGRMIPDRKRFKDIKVILTVHDLNPLHEDRSPEDRRKSVAHTQTLIDQSDSIVCISEFCRKDVLQNCDTGNKPVSVIHNGTNSLQAPALHIGSYTPRRPFLFGIGYINRKKNYHVLLSLLREDENLELVIAGRHDEPDYIRMIVDQARAWGIADRVSLPGPITEMEKAWYLNHCHAFVHPSLAEGFGFPVIEAMAFGKPIFLSDKTALPEIGGDAAFYFSSFLPEHMRDVFRTGMRHYESNGMSEHIRMRGRQFDWKKSAAAYLKVYQQQY